MAPVIYGSHNKSEIKSSFLGSILVQKHWPVDCNRHISLETKAVGNHHRVQASDGWFTHTFRQRFPPLPLQRIQNIHEMHAVLSLLYKLILKKKACDDYEMEII